MENKGDLNAGACMHGQTMQFVWSIYKLLRNLVWKPIATIGNRGWFQLISWCVCVAITTLGNRGSQSMQL